MNRSNGWLGGFSVVLSVWVLLGAVGAAPGQTVWYVDDNAVGDPGPGDVGISDPAEDGSAAHPFDAIQEAIDASTNGDKVLVAEGMYCGVGNRDMEYGGRAITVRSVSGPENCVIDCEGLGRGFYFGHGEREEAVLDGLTITNGYGHGSEWHENGGGGILCFHTSPTIRSCVFVANHGAMGGGIRVTDFSRPTISNCSFTSNTAELGGGGLCVIEGCGGTVSGCRFFGNSAAWGGGIDNCVSYTRYEDCVIGGNAATEGGGGVFNDRSGYGSADPVYVNCQIVGNSTASGGDGGGVYNQEDYSTFIDCLIADNTALQPGFGGGVYNNWSSSTFTNCEVRNNLANAGGGAYSWEMCDVKWTNCIISNNRALNSAALHNFQSSLTLTNCTIKGNRGEFSKAILSARGSLTMVNTIAWDNTPLGLHLYFCEADVRHCDIEGGYTGVGNIDENPIFGTGSDLRLASTSPCIDAGTNGQGDEFPIVDMDGKDRVLDGNGDGLPSADIGAFEFDRQARHIAVSETSLEFQGIAGEDVGPTQSLTFRNCGIGLMTWEITDTAEWLQVTPSGGVSGAELVTVMVSVDLEDLQPGVYNPMLTIADVDDIAPPREVAITVQAGRVLAVPQVYPTIQEAMDAAVDSDRILVAEGTYRGEGNKNVDFLGKAVELCSVGGPCSCIIDCEHDGRAFLFDSGERSTSVVDGFTIVNGSAMTLEEETGGAILCGFAFPTITNCVIRDCVASFGGAIYVQRDHAYSSDDKIRLLGCTLSGNRVSLSGGAIYCCASSIEAEGCVLRDNAAVYHGGALYQSNNSRSAFINTVIEGNSADLNGGGIRDDNGTQLNLVGCVVSGNYSATGGVLELSLSTAALSNCTISGNMTETGSGVVACEYGESLELQNCIVAGNRPAGIIVDEGEIRVARCNIEGGTGQAWFGAGNIDVDPLFVDADGPDDDPDTWEDNDYRLQAGSPCIDAGSNGMVPLDFGDIDGDGDVLERMPWDLDGLTRFVDDPATVDTGVADPPLYVAVVDMGAYEFGGVRVGDFDGDYDVDLADYAGLQVCVAGDLAGSAECVAAFDFDGDGVVSIGDFGPFELVLAGP